MGGKGSGGANAKYSATAHREIVKNIELGMFKAHAAAAAGIARRTLDLWLQLGEAGGEPYSRFAEDVRRAEATNMKRYHAIITKAATGKHDGDWKAAAWMLERKYPKLYGRGAAEQDAPPSAAGERPYSPWKEPAA